MSRVRSKKGGYANASKVSVKNLKGRAYFNDKGVNNKKIKLTFNRCCVAVQQNN
jgi:hypothetical protein